MALINYDKKEEKKPETQVTKKTETLDDIFDTKKPSTSASSPVAEQPKTETKEEVEKVSCPTCSGSGEVMEIVDHDHDYNSVWETRQCWRCHGTGQIIKK